MMAYTAIGLRICQQPIFSSSISQMVCALVCAHDLPYTRYFIYWVDTRLYLFSLVNDLGVILTLASFSVRSPGLALLPTLLCLASSSTS